MPSTMNRRELLVVVFMLAVRTDVSAEKSCIQSSNSADCSQVATTVPHSTHQEPVQPAIAGSCNFKYGTCGYKQGCRQERGPKWSYNSAEGYFQMRAIEPGHHNTISVLESHFLNISAPSCLRFTASFKLPVKLSVLLSFFNGNCTVFNKKSREVTRPESLQLPPIGAAKVLFQGFDGGDTKRVLLLYNVAVDVGCCQDPVWSNARHNVANKPNRPYCNWSVSNWVINASDVAVLNNVSVGTLTTPLIRATTPGFGDSITFEYSLSDDDGSVLDVSIVDLHNKHRILWTSSDKKHSNTSNSNYLKGDVTVSPSTAFQIRFTGKRETASSVVAIWNVQYIRENTPLASGEESGSNAGGIAAGVIIALLVIVAVAIGVVILWRKKRAKSGAGPGASTSIEDMMNDGRQRSAHQYARTESVAPLAMHEDQSEPTNYYSIIKDVPSAQKTAGSENDGYAVAKDVAPQGGVKNDDDTTNPYDTADSDTDGTTNPAFVDDYNHIGAGARNKDAAASSDGKRDDYNHVNTHCARASKTNRNADGPLRSNEYHELERVDSDATPHTANNDGGNTPHDEYNRLGNIKGGNPAATEGRGATPRAYDHVGLTETEGDPYDLARQDKRNNRVDPDYNRLGDI